MIGRAALLALCLPAAAQAACTGDTVLSCPVGGGDVLEVCATANGFTYAFGPEGAPELQLSAPYDSLPVTPWPGVGRAIWSSVRFANEDYTYEVWTSVDRLTAKARPEAGVIVTQGDSLVAERTCTPGTAAVDPFHLSDAMEVAGFCWHFDSQSWRRAGQCG